MDLRNFFRNTSTESLHQVSSLSKILAAVIFIVTPFIGGYVGFLYARSMPVQMEYIQPLCSDEDVLDPVGMGDTNDELRNRSDVDYSDFVNEETYSPGKSPTEETLLSFEVVERQIKDIITVEAESVDQCKLLPMGAALCGGPGYYLPYSNSSATDIDTLMSLARQHQIEVRTYNQEHTSDMAGICVITPEPKLAIKNGECVTIVE